MSSPPSTDLGQSTIDERPATDIDATDDTLAMTTTADSVETVHILDALASNDGGLPQQELVAALDVSKATVSRRLSTLEDEERIIRLLFRGRKLIWLPDRVPAALDPNKATNQDPFTSG